MKKVRHLGGNVYDPGYVPENAANKTGDITSNNATEYFNTEAANELIYVNRGGEGVLFFQDTPSHLPAYNRLVRGAPAGEALEIDRAHCNGDGFGGFGPIGWVDQTDPDDIVQNSLGYLQPLQDNGPSRLILKEAEWKLESWWGVSHVDGSETIGVVELGKIKSDGTGKVVFGTFETPPITGLGPIKLELSLFTEDLFLEADELIYARPGAKTTSNTSGFYGKFWHSGTGEFSSRLYTPLPSKSFVPVIDATYAELEALAVAERLSANQLYKITDYHTKYIQPFSCKLKIHEFDAIGISNANLLSSYEQIVVRAISDHEISTGAYSETFGDTLKYDFTDDLAVVLTEAVDNTVIYFGQLTKYLGKVYRCTMFRAQATLGNMPDTNPDFTEVCNVSDLTRTGFIKRRTTKEGVSYPEDIRAIKYARFKPNFLYNVSDYSTFGTVAEYAGSALAGEIYKENGVIAIALRDTNAPDIASNAVLDFCIIIGDDYFMPRSTEAKYRDALSYELMPDPENYVEYWAVHYLPDGTNGILKTDVVFKNYFGDCEEQELQNTVMVLYDANSRCQNNEFLAADNINNTFYDNLSENYAIKNVQNNILRGGFSSNKLFGEVHGLKTWNHFSQNDSNEYQNNCYDCVFYAGKTRNVLNNNNGWLVTGYFEGNRTAFENMANIFGCPSVTQNVFGNGFQRNRLIAETEIRGNTYPVGMQDKDITGDQVNNFSVGIDSRAEGATNVAIGEDAFAVGDENTALGRGAHVFGKGSVALGNNSTTNGSRTINIGRGEIVGSERALIGSTVLGWEDNREAADNDYQALGWTSTTLDDSLDVTRTIITFGAVNASTFFRWGDYLTLDSEGDAIPELVGFISKVVGVDTGAKTVTLETAVPVFTPDGTNIGVKRTVMKVAIYGSSDDVAVNGSTPLVNLDPITNQNIFAGYIETIDMTAVINKRTRLALVDGAISATLPTTVPVGHLLTIKKTDAGTETELIGVVDGMPDPVLTEQYETLRLIWLGSEWGII